MTTAQPTSPPTARQLEVHAFMVAFHDEHGIWPSMREIGEALDIASTNAVAAHLQALKRKGLVRQRPRCARGWIAVVEQPR